MIERKEHEAYELLKTKYDRLSVDYVILALDGEYKGQETHKQAVIKAFEILNQRYADFDYLIDIDTDKMQATKINMTELLELPSDDFYGARPKVRSRSFNIPSPLPYWFAFLEPPHGVPYLKSDFIQFNDLLFPNKEDTEVYRWSDDFSNYFDAGKEYFGTGLWTAFDKITNTFVVIGVSLTD